MSVLRTPTVTLTISKLLRAEMFRMEQIIDARLKQLEKHLRR